MDIVMPKMGESINEGTIIKWHKKQGDSVLRDEIIFEISTDKVDTEIPAPVDGILSEILVGEQETVQVGTVVAHLTADSLINNSNKEKSADEVPVSDAAINDGAKDVFSEQPADIIHTKEEVKEEIGFLSPLVLSIARKENIGFDEIKRIKGTGLEGRISKKDILLYIDRKTETSNEKDVFKNEIQSVKSTASVGDSEVIPMDNIRQKIMQHMINSRNTSVHVNSLIEVDLGRINNFIQLRKEEFLSKEGFKLTYMPFIANAVVKALQEFPLVNSSIEGTTIYKKKYINLGIAVAMEPNGLIVPNIKNAGDKNISGLGKSIKDIAERARSKKLTPDDISNGTFTITNYGVFGITYGTPVINQPEVAILGVGVVIKKPVVIEIDGTESIAIKPLMGLTLAHDHRLIDGMLGGKFLKFVKDYLEGFNPNSF